MSVREINQRWLATMGLSDEHIRLRGEVAARAAGLRAAYGARPSWWRPLARRRWDRCMAGVEQRAERFADDGMLPCPFCRSTEVNVGVSTGETYPRVVCGDCGARGPRARSDADREAIANWNRRPGQR
jgi:Lar family restriction alleviation protein